MGKDGAEGLNDIRKAGGVTIAQSSTSCVVDSMPKAARDSGAAALVASADKIPQLLISEAARLNERRNRKVSNL
jgi:two-component system chemotaxis response regulator CheB